MQNIEINDDRKISDTHFVIIDCKPGLIRPDAFLQMVLIDDDPDFEEDDALMFNDAISFEDFTLIYSNFGEWKFGVFKDKELLFELNLPKIIDNLTKLYKCGQIRYAEWSPK
jgi:hypothetical protein